LDKLLSRVQQQGFRSKFLAVGSTAGLQAAQRGECDLAGIHLLDAASGEYNRPFVTPELTLLPGYARRQGIVFRADDARFADRSPDEILALVARDETTRMVNRNTGSGTRILLDGKLSGVKPPGYAAQVSSHNAVAAAVAQGRADWGVAIQAVAAGYHLGFAPLAWERFDFVTPTSRAARPAVACLNGLLNDDGVRAELTALGFSFAA
jgi:putative molybdopterin biosynthesis protein